MVPTELRDAIRAQTVLIAKRTTSTVIRGYCGVIDGLADQIPALVPPIVERRAGRERRERDMAFQGPGRRVGPRRGALQQQPTTPVVTRVTITNEEPPNFEPTDTFQLTVVVESDAVRVQDGDGADYYTRSALTGRTVTYASSDTNICTVNASGLVTAVAVGNCNITAACEGVTSTAIVVTVTLPLSAVSTVGWSPSDVTMQEGGATATLTAIPRDASSNSLLGKTVTWSTSNSAAVALSATTTNSDPHTVTLTPGVDGSSTVTATCDGVSNTMLVTVSAVSALYPNEPAGFSRICEANFTAKPGTQGGVSQNQVAGYWWRTSTASMEANMTLATDAAAPVSPSSVLRYRFPSGMTDGVEPVYFIGWSNSSLASTGEPGYDELYISQWVKIEGSDYQNQSTGTKIYYINYGNTGRMNHSTSFLMGEGNAGSTVTRTAFRMRWSCTSMNADGSDPGYAYNYEQNVDTRALFTVGTWHQFESYLKTNTLNLADGQVKFWLDGVLLGNHTNIRFRSTQSPLKFHQLRYAPVFGGSAGEVRSRDDFWNVDHIYVSGKIYP